MTKYYLLDYMNRSGSTYLSRVVATNSKVCVCPENAPLGRLIYRREYLTDTQARKLSSTIDQLVEHDCDWELWRDIWTASGFRFRKGPVFPQFLHLLDQYRSMSCPDAHVVLFKGGPVLKYVEKYPEIVRDFPVTILALVRDGRAVYASQRNAVSTGTNRPMQISPIRCAKNWSRYMRRLERAGQVCEITPIYYETLINDPTIIHSMLRLEKPCSGGQYSTRQEIAPLKIASNQRHLHNNVASPAIESRIASWKSELCVEDICLFESIAGRELVEHGYSLCEFHHTAIRHWIRRSRWCLRWILHVIGGQMYRLRRNVMIRLIGHSA